MILTPQNLVHLSMFTLYCLVVPCLQDLRMLFVAPSELPCFWIDVLTACMPSDVAWTREDEHDLDSQDSESHSFWAVVYMDGRLIVALAWETMVGLTSWELLGLLLLPHPLSSLGSSESNWKEGMHKILAHPFFEASSRIKFSSQATKAFWNIEPIELAIEVKPFSIAFWRLASCSLEHVLCEGSGLLERVASASAVLPPLESRSP